MAVVEEAKCKNLSLDRERNDRITIREVSCEVRWMEVVQDCV